MIFFHFFVKILKLATANFFFGSKTREFFFQVPNFFLMPRAKIRIGKEQKSESFQKTNFLLFGVGIKVGRA